jgi:hypothetical protein
MATEPGSFTPRHAKGSKTSQAPEEDLSEGPKAARERIGFVVSLAGSVFGILCPVGLLFLPAVTLVEKTYIVAGCGALSVASVSALGAWANARRFGITIAAMLMAVLCMAALAVALNIGRPATPQETASCEPVSASGPTAVPKPALQSGGAVEDGYYCQCGTGATQGTQFHHGWQRARHTGARHWSQTRRGHAGLSFHDQGPHLRTGR